DSVIVGQLGTSTGNSLLVAGGRLTATNASGSGVLDVRHGTLTLNNGGSITTDKLLLTNGAGVLVFNAGTLSTSSSFISNNLTAVIGNGASSAQWNMHDGVQSLAVWLTLSSRAFVSVSTAQLSVSGMVTNTGTINFLNSVGTFNSQVVNAGAWITDLTTNTFLGTYSAAPSGYIDAAAGDVYTFQGDFINQSTQSSAWQTLNVTPGIESGSGTKFVFDGTGLTLTQRFDTVGKLLTGGFVGTPDSLSNGVQYVSAYSDVAGFVNNFAVGELALTNHATLLFDQAQSSLTTNALFVNDLFLAADTRLIVSDNMRVYFVNSNSWNMSQVTLLGNAEIHQLIIGGVPVAVPEPTVVLMWLAGAVTIWAVRRRQSRPV
ncbi:MAG: hypothetical protein WCH84_09160, partial [Verrucomicrobiota bacterium]